MKQLSLENTHLPFFNINLMDDEITLFNGIKYVVMQGSIDRTKEFAIKYYRLVIKSIDSEPMNLFYNSSYFVAYKVQNVLFVSHGMGFTSILPLLNDLTKLMFRANNLEVRYIRVGTSGGINIPPGSVVLTETAYMPNLNSGFRAYILGQDLLLPTKMSSILNQEILQSVSVNLKSDVLLGNSIAANDFYLGQARLDGAITPSFNDVIRQEYFQKIKKLNILNFEMESVAFAMFCNQAEIDATMVAVTLLDRFKGDQINANASTLKEYSSRAQNVVTNYLLNVT